MLDLSLWIAALTCPLLSSVCACMCVRACVHHLIGPLSPPLLYHSSLFSDTLARCLFASSLRLSIPSSPPSCLPPLAGLHLLAVLRGNYQSSEMLSYCTATLALPCLPLPTHVWTYANTHTHTHIYNEDRHGQRNNPTCTQRLHSTITHPFHCILSTHCREHLVKYSDYQNDSLYSSTT